MEMENNTNTWKDILTSGLLSTFQPFNLSDGDYRDPIMVNEVDLSTSPVTIPDYTSRVPTLEPLEKDEVHVDTLLPDYLENYDLTDEADFLEYNPNSSNLYADHNFPLSNGTDDIGFEGGGGFNHDPMSNQLLLEFSDRSISLGELPSDESHSSWVNCLQTFISKKLSPGHDPLGCQMKFDGASCWPETPAGSVSTIACFAEFVGVTYDATQNATLECYDNGTWAELADYDNCKEIVAIPQHPQADNTKLMIFYGGFTVSLVAVVMALMIFTFFKDLRCLRNTIHTNLLISYFLHNLLWLLSASLLLHGFETIGCGFLVLLEYAGFTNFMWMFVEGLYLYVLVVKTFSVENIKLRVYLVIGWAIGIPIIIAWLFARIYIPGYVSSYEDPEFSTMQGCFLHMDSPLNWIYRVPILCVLTANILFLTRIMWVLITKLKSAKTVETLRYRKAAKALMVLIPLLGLNYVLLIALPQALEHLHLHPILLSTQGLWVALFYCFLNGEVQNSIRHHIQRWKTERDLIDSRMPDRSGRDLSPRSRNKLTRYGRRILSGMGRKRESVCSEVTTTTTFFTNGSNVPHQNFIKQKTSKQLLPLYQIPSQNSHLLQRQFRHSQPNLTQTSSFTTTNSRIPECQTSAIVDGPSCSQPQPSCSKRIDCSLPVYRPVSRNSNRSSSPFDPPNIPLITSANPNLASFEDTDNLIEMPEESSSPILSRPINEDGNEKSSSSSDSDDYNIESGPEAACVPQMAANLVSTTVQITSAMSALCNVGITQPPKSAVDESKSSEPQLSSRELKDSTV